MILTAEADSSPTDEKKLLEDYGLTGSQASRSNDLSGHTKFDSSGHVRLLWESNENDKNGHAAIFEVKFYFKTGVTTDSRERTAGSLFDTLESVALAVLRQ